MIRRTMTPKRRKPPPTAPSTIFVFLQLVPLLIRNVQCSFQTIPTTMNRKRYHHHPYPRMESHPFFPLLSLSVAAREVPVSTNDVSTLPPPPTTTTMNLDPIDFKDSDFNENDNNDDGNDNGTIEFPPPLTPLQRIQRGIEFYKRVGPVLLAYKMLDIKLQLRREILRETITDEEEQHVRHQLDDWGSTEISNTIQDMKGFYVKTGQVISTRVDLFPIAYTVKLQQLQDSLEPMPYEIVEQVVRQELLHGQPLGELFASFDKEPLGAASIAQVHKATLLDGRVVAVKLQRPNVEPKLRGDVANLKRVTKVLADFLPLDYYTIFSELADVLDNELNFLLEAQAMKKIHLAIAHTTAGQPTSITERPVTVPLPVGELVTQRVLVMDFVDGVALNQLAATLEERGIEQDSPEAKLAGRRVLDSLADAFSRMIFGAGFIHGDPHPGNIFIGEGGTVSLIDCGQFKAVSRQQRVLIANLVLAVDDYQTATTELTRNIAKRKVADIVYRLGVTFVEGKEGDDDLACSTSLYIFGNADEELPGGYSKNELDDNAPLQYIKSFPQELVLLGRATVLLKGIAKRLGLEYSIAAKLRPGCEDMLTVTKDPMLPLWGKNHAATSTITTGPSSVPDGTSPNGTQKIRFAQVLRLFQQWGKSKSQRVMEGIVKRSPPKLRRRMAKAALRRQERKDAAAASKRRN